MQRMLNDLLMLQVLRVEHGAIRLQCSPDDETIPIRELIAKFDLPGVFHNISCHGDDCAPGRNRLYCFLNESVINLMFEQRTGKFVEHLHTDDDWI